LREDGEPISIIKKEGKEMFLLQTGGGIGAGGFVTLNPISGDYNNRNSNPSSRLSEVRGLIRFAEARVKDLEALLSSLILNKPLEDYDVNGDGTKDVVIIPEVDNEDENQVRQQLYGARAYEGFLRNEENFWNSIRDANKSAEKQTQDFFKPA
jgi:hypothetical protein